ncbi:MAG: hypothetical protein ACOC5D_06085 [Thermoplasmatota archaeon]
MGNNKVNDERNGFIVRPAHLRSPRMDDFDRDTAWDMIGILRITVKPLK